MSFSFQGVAPQQRHRACLLPPRQLCPGAQLPSPAACPPARAKRPLGPPLWQAWAHPPSQESLGGGEQLATGEKMITPTSQCCGHQTTDPAHHRHAQTRGLACPASVASSHSRTGTGKQRAGFRVEGAPSPPWTHIQGTHRASPGGDLGKNPRLLSCR